MRKTVLLLLVAFMLSAGGCTLQPVPATPTASPLPSTATATATFTPTPTLTSTPTITPTATWVFQPAGTVTCPILLYHRIAYPPDPTKGDAQYYVTPEDFETQMRTLHDWGYTTIPVSLLIDAIKDGAPLPPRPVVITFDDGWASVYENAFPVMRRYGFTAVTYLVVNYIGQDQYMTLDQVNSLLAAGWEVGSHSRNHVNLVAFPATMNDEAYRSRLDLEKLLDVQVATFAYPFGEASDFVIDHVDGYGYRGAMGLGMFYVHDRASLFYLSRIEVKYGTDPAWLAQNLPWSDLSWGAATPTP
jgi:peptidoglycan/xylan/chitin deacetylase (PgdA/CDA1 family)